MKILGLDMGTNSIGWAVIETDATEKPSKIEAAGVRIFNSGRDPQKGASLAVARREKRGQRRRRDRMLQRKHDVMSLLVRFGLMPQNAEQRKALEGKKTKTGEKWEDHPYNPYMLRAKAAAEKLEPYELGRALFHLNQRRGFQSNRKIDKQDGKKETEKAKEKLKVSLDGRTLGQFLWDQHQKRETVRFRPTPVGNKNSYDLYPTRQMYEDEFDQIRAVQEKHHALTAAQWVQLRKKILSQRPLKKPKVGRCQLYFNPETVHPETGEITPQQERAPIALPSAQLFRIIQDINNLKLRKGPFGSFEVLDNDERSLQEKRKTLLKLFCSKGEVSFEDIRKALKLDDDIEFNLAAKRSKLKGDTVYATLKKYFGKEWLELPLQKKDAIVIDLLEVEDDNLLFEKALQEWGLTEEKSRELVANISPAKFDDGYSRFSQKALHVLTPLMIGGLRYDQACAALGGSHSVRDFEGTETELPYYGLSIPESVVEPHNPSTAAGDEKRGKISNPTVHIGLRQLQKIVNEIIKNHGKPDIIRIEMARDLKMSKEEKDKLASEQLKNEKENERIKKELTERGIWVGEKKGEKHLKYKLWEELNLSDVNDRKCPYTGKTISMDLLFSDEIEIEHILPFSRTLDDSRANKTVAFRSVNRDKREQSPYEAFSKRPPAGSTDREYSYERILQRAENMPSNKRWRFSEDAMKKYADENTFLARQLNDTRHLSKIAKRYLSLISKRVDVSTGRLTSIMRRAWGLNEILGHNRKNRDDHRQHAVDAIVIALTDLGTVKKVMTLNARGENPEKIVAEDLPIGFWEQVRDKIAGTDYKQGIVVSHRPEHGTGGALHEDSYYGVLYHPDLPAEQDRRTEWEKENGFNIVTRKTLTDLSQNEVSQIRDPLIRAELEALMETLPATVKKKGEKEKRVVNPDALKAALHAFGISKNIRRVRILKKDASVKIIKHRQGNLEHIKGVSPGDVHHVSFWQTPDGQLVSLGVSLFDANQKDQNGLKPHPAAKLLMKLHKGDLVRLEHKGEEKTARVMSLKPANEQIVLVEHFEGGNIIERQKEEKIQIFLSFSKALEAKVRKIYVSPTGKVYDPKPLKVS